MLKKGVHMFEMAEGEDMGSAKIRVVGIGGGGCNAVNTMIRAGLCGVEYIVVNTDAQALNASLAPTKVQLGAEITKGLGAGANPEIGRKAALDDYEKLGEVIKDSDMVFITAGMGGGTGTGAAPVIAQLGKELGALTVGVVTKPFQFEGKRRMRQATQGIVELEECVDSLITIPNQRLLQLAGENLSLVETFKKADEILLNAVQGISDLINNTGLINADFADVSTVMANKGMALMGTGICSGADRAVKAANDAISSPLLEDITIDGATGIIANITGDKTLTTHEANEAMTLIMEAADEDAEIIFGTVIDESLKDSIKITVIATGLAGSDRSREVIAGPRGGKLPPELKMPVAESVSLGGRVERGEEVDGGGETREDVELPVEPVERAAQEVAGHEQEGAGEKTVLASRIKESAKKHFPQSSVQTGGSEHREQGAGSRAQSIAERLGFIHFNEDELDRPSYLRKDQQRADL